MKYALIICIAAFLISCGKSDHQYQGYIEADNLYIASPYGGKLIQLYSTRGAHVKKGDLLAVLDPAPEMQTQKANEALYQEGLSTLEDLKKPKRKPEIDAIQAQIQQAEAQLALAAIRVKRNQILFDKHVMDKDTLDAALERFHELEGLKAQYEANLALALLGARADQIAAQEHQVTALSMKLNESVWESNQKKLIAPTDGVIFDTYYRPSEYVAPQQAVLSLLAPENTHIEFFVPLNDLARLHLGKRIYFSYENQKNQIPVKVVYISPEAEYMPPLVYSRENSDKIVFRIKAAAEKALQLIPGEPVIVTVGVNDD